MFTKMANGHDMEINHSYGMGGGLEETFFWCHTCDEYGEDITVWYYNGDLAHDLTLALQFSQVHETIGVDE